MIYFTSDLHLGHTNIIKYNNRPFKTVDEMDNVLINNWNNIVTNKDIIYVLGDLTMRVDNNEITNYLNRLNGKEIYLLKGNHDYFLDNPLNIDGVLDNNISIYYGYAEIKYNHRKFILCHYPILDWNGKNHGSIHLHGHIHSIGMKYNLDNKNKGQLRYDVGVDANNFMPVSIDQIIKYFNGVKICADRHGGK